LSSGGFRGGRSLKIRHIETSIESRQFIGFLYRAVSIPQICLSWEGAESLKCSLEKGFNLLSEGGYLYLEEYFGEKC
jgi:hypothetical protein